MKIGAVFGDIETENVKLIGLFKQQCPGGIYVFNLKLSTKLLFFMS